MKQGNKVQTVVAWAKKNRLYFLVIVAAILIVVFLFWENTARMISDLRQISEVKTKIAEEQAATYELDAEVAKIGTRSYVEEMARSVLHLYYPNEKIVNLVSAEKIAEEQKQEEEAAKAAQEAAEQAEKEAQEEAEKAAEEEKKKSEEAEGEAQEETPQEGEKSE